MQTRGDAAAEHLAPPTHVSDRSKHDPTGSGHETVKPEHSVRPGWTDLLRLAFVLACATAVWFRLWEPFPRLSLIGLVGTVIGGWPIFAEAWENIRARRMTMELSMTIALAAALVIAEFFTALVITAFVLVAEILERLTVGCGRKAIAQLLDLLPDAGETTRVFVARGERYLGAIDVVDAIRPETRQAVATLRALGLRTVLLTGDRRLAAAAVAREVGVDDFAAELLPAAKQEYVQGLVRGGRRVAMVGDGVDDAPALMQASVGVAMGSGTNVARAGAGVVLLSNDLLALVETLKLARRTRRTILQNFTGTLLVDGVGIGLAAFGMLDPLLAAFIHVTSELAFILNSARLLPAVARRHAPS